MASKIFNLYGFWQNDFFYQNIVKNATKMTKYKSKL
jgi:hypothetical protein